MMTKMEKIKFLSKVKENLFHLRLENDKEATVNMSNLLKSMGFTKDKDLDLYYPDMEEEYIFSSDKNLNLHVFITKKYVHLIVETKNITCLNRLQKIIEKFS